MINLSGSYGKLIKGEFIFRVDYRLKIILKPFYDLLRITYYARKSECQHKEGNELL